MCTSRTLTMLLACLLFGISKLSAQTEYFVSINQQTASFNKLSKIANVEWVYPSLQVYNQREHRYYIAGSIERDRRKMQLYTIDALSGKTLHSTPLNVTGKFDNPACFVHHFESNNIYGIYWNDERKEEYFVGMDAQTGKFDSLALWPEVKWIKDNTGTIKDNEYYFVGANSDFVARIYSIRLNDKHITVGPILNDSIVFLSMNYDKILDKFICLTTSKGNRDITVTHFDIKNNKHHVVNAVRDCNGVADAGVAYDERNHRYIYFGVNDAPPALIKNLLTVSAVTGDVIYNPLMPQLSKKDNLICYAYDTTYSRLVGLHWEENTGVPESPEIYPNPFNAELNIRFKNFYGSLTVLVYNMMNQLVKKEVYTNTYKINIERKSMADGVYILQVFNNENFERLVNSKVVVQ